jgi:hypothetical protein
MSNVQQLSDRIEVLERGKSSTGHESNHKGIQGLHEQHLAHDEHLASLETRISNLEKHVNMPVKEPSVTTDVDPTKS